MIAGGDRRILARLVVAKSGVPQGFELRAGDRTFPLTFDEAQELADIMCDELKRLIDVAHGMRTPEDQDEEPPRHRR